VKKFLYTIIIANILGCSTVPNKVGECYSGADSLVKIVEVKGYGLFWMTMLPYENPNAYTRWYETFYDFNRTYKRVDCWTDK